jgi:hypothetical protein
MLIWLKEKGIVNGGRGTIDIDFIGDCDIITQNTDVLQSCPSTNCAVPAYDGALDPGMVFDS